MDHTTNEEVLRRMDKTVKIRKMEYTNIDCCNSFCKERLTVGEDREGGGGYKTCANGLGCHLRNYLDRHLIE